MKGPPGLKQTSEVSGILVSPSYMQSTGLPSITNYVTSGVPPVLTEAEDYHDDNEDEHDNDDDDEADDLNAILKFISELQSQRQEILEIKFFNLAVATHSLAVRELCTVTETGIIGNAALDVAKTTWEINSSGLAAQNIFHPLDFLDLPDVAELSLTCVDWYTSKLGLDYFHRCCPGAVPEITGLFVEDFGKSYNLDTSGTFPGSVSCLEPFP